MNTNIELDVEQLETAINNLLQAISEEECNSAEYSKMLDQLVKLYKAKETHINLKLKEIETDVKRHESESTIHARAIETRIKDVESEQTLLAKAVETQLKQRDLDKPWRVSPDTLAIIGANLGGILLIIGYERANVIASKAVAFVSKLR